MRRAIGLAVVVMLAASSAQAAVLFSEDFENLTVGEVLNGNTPTSNGGSWLVWGSFAKVAANPNGTGNVINYENANSLGRLWANVGGKHKGNLIVKYDFLIPNKAGNPVTYLAATMVDEATNTPNESVKTAVASVSPTANFWNYQTPSPGYDTIALNLPNGSWYSVTMEIPDYAGQTGNVSFFMTLKDSSGNAIVDRKQFASLGDAATSEMNMLRIGGHTSTTTANSSYFYLDNVSISTIPEPATMMLIGVGGLACVVRNRK